MLSDYCDAVVMLTWSNWRTEMRSNRHHYALRFAAHVPVLFVQPDLKRCRHEFEQTELPNVTVLHVGEHYVPEQSARIGRALAEREIHNPLLWIYNFLFSDFILSTWAPIKVYHATEDYFCRDFLPEFAVEQLLNVLAGCDMLVSVSEGVEEDYLRKGRFRGKSVVATNGCDFRQWAGCAASPDRGKYGQIALYQGGINKKVDFEMVLRAAREMPDWSFLFCGEVGAEPADWQDQWKTLCALDNVEYVGKLPLEGLKDCMSRATVGLIPFVQNDWIVERSFPLKAFEYLACGLPVVTVPIRALQPYAELLVQVRTPQEMPAAIRRAVSDYTTPRRIEAGLAAAKAQDYDLKFQRVVEEIQACIPGEEVSVGRRNVLVLYDEHSTHVNTLREHLDSFGTYSRHNIHYAPATREAPCRLGLSVFDAVVVHYSIRVNLPGHHISASYAQALKEFKGLKILFVQDDYDTPATAWEWINDMGIHVVYTCVPRDCFRVAYPPRRFPHTEFVETLTGFVPIEMERPARAKPAAQRRYVLGYRGRVLPYWYGTLGHEKLMIGVTMKRICQERGIACNIEWDNEHRIYGPGWYDFIEDCRAVLGSETGADIFDIDGTLSKRITAALEKEPDMTFDEAFERFLRHYEGRVTMSVISPKVFEAIALRTALVLFEGTYSGVVRADEHFIPLKKDYSNVDEVLAKLDDIEYLDELTARAHRDILASGRYSYRAFVRGFDDMLARKLRRGAAGSVLISTVVWARPRGGQPRALCHTKPLGALPTDVVLPVPLEQYRRRMDAPQILTGLRHCWSWLPSWVRWPIKLVLKPAVRLARDAVRAVRSRRPTQMPTRQQPPPPAQSPPAEAPDTTPRPAGALAEHCDAVVMLTWSDWRTEMRSNRHHYAKRFAEHLPVLFVQTDLKKRGHAFEETELPNVTILHVGWRSGPERTAELGRALDRRGVRKPLLWVYNFLLSDFVLSTWAPIKVYHATEDYFCRDFLPEVTVERLRGVLAGCDLLVSVSEGVQEDYLQQGKFRGASLVATNGCDFQQWAGCASSRDRGRHAQVALYQGGINKKIDFELLLRAAREMPDWSFWFCGEVALAPEDGLDQWKTLCAMRNVRYIGKLSLDQLKDRMSQATVGLIPFVQNDWIVERSFPLKAFEYLACGLPVVTVPIRALEPYGDLFVQVRTAEEMPSAIRRAASEYGTDQKLQAGLAAAKAQDYDLKFQAVVAKIEECLTTVEPAVARRNVLVLYDENSIHVNTLREHLESFGTYSCHRVHYAPATGDARCAGGLSLFDAVVTHYSVRVNMPEPHMSASYTGALREYKGLKVLFVQDEYDTTCTTWRWINDTGIHVVYTCVPRDYVTVAYPPRRFPHTEFIENLTGYVPTHLERHAWTRPMARRRRVLGYRGRKLPYWYGRLGREKLTIGVNMRRICEKRGIPCDIEWDPEHRIYGPDWYDFIEDCRAMLGTESGANVFDFDGTLSRDITAALEENPDLTFEEAFERFLRDHQGKVVMNQVSPKIFEAIALRTALVLFEGSYSGVVRPDEHYIPLKKDYSNVDDVLARLEDIEYLEELTARAHRDIIASGRYSYRAFVGGFDDMLAAKLRKGTSNLLVSSLVAFRPCGGDLATPCHSKPIGALPTTSVLPAGLTQFQKEMKAPEMLTGIRRYWTRLPPPARWPIKVLLKPPVRFLRAAARSIKRTPPHEVTPLQAAILRWKMRTGRRSIVIKQLSKIFPDHIRELRAPNEKGPYLKISGRTGRVRMTAATTLGGPGLRVRSVPSPAESDLHATHPPDGLRLTQWRDLGRQSWRYELDDGLCVLWDELPVEHAEVPADLLSILMPACFEIRRLESGFILASKAFTLRGDVRLSHDVRITDNVTFLVAWRGLPLRVRRDPITLTLSVSPTYSTRDLQSVCVLQAGPQEPAEADMELLQDAGGPWGLQLRVRDVRYLLLGPNLPEGKTFPGSERVPETGRPVAVRYDGDEADVVWAVTDEGVVRFG